jgi:hypothetical protein
VSTDGDIYGDGGLRFSYGNGEEDVVYKSSQYAEVRDVLSEYTAISDASIYYLISKNLKSGETNAKGKRSRGSVAPDSKPTKRQRTSGGPASQNTQEAESLQAQLRENARRSAKHVSRHLNAALLLTHSMLGSTSNI